MQRELAGLRPVLSLPEESFGRLLGNVLSPSRPLQSEEFLRGRADQLDGIRKALYAPGRHVFIHGFRGVGKSSLAQTAAFSISGQTDPVLLGCETNNSFASIVRDLFEEVAGRSPAIARITTETNLGLNFDWLQIGHGTTHEETPVAAPATINEAVRLVDYLCQHYDPGLVVVIDEFDQLSDAQEQAKFANFIKQLSDKHITARFIFCGIGTSVDALMAAHGSVDRYFHTVSLDRLPYEARLEIVSTSASRLGVMIDETTMLRIAKISDGFPHYVHLIAEKLFWKVFEAGTGSVSTEDFEAAMSAASNALDMKLKKPYETATRKYTNEYENILFAVADGHELQRRSSDVYDSYLRIMDTRRSPPLDRAKFNQRMNNMKKSNYGSILAGTRTGWYEFSEKIVRGYTRLRAEQQGIDLEVDHPSAKRRFGWRG